MYAELPKVTLWPVFVAPAPQQAKRSRSCRSAWRSWIFQVTVRLRPKFRCELWVNSWKCEKYSSNSRAASFRTSLSDWRSILRRRSRTNHRGIYPSFRGRMEVRPLGDTRDIVPSKCLSSQRELENCQKQARVPVNSLNGISAGRIERKQLG